MGRHPLGVHTLFLRDPTMSWYLLGIEGMADSPQGVAAFINREQQRLGTPRLLTMGSSMGGYAALLIGSLARADVALAFGPQVYLDQASLRLLEPEHDVPAQRGDVARMELDMVRMELNVRARGFGKYLRLVE